MASRKTWIWILVGTASVGTVALLTVAGAGIYFVSQHVHTNRSTNPEALHAFDTALARFPHQRPLYDVDAANHPKLTRSLAGMPTSPVTPTTLVVLAWDPEGGRLIRMSLPFWLLRVGQQRIHVSSHEGGFDLERLDLDLDELERIGPTLVLDYRNEDGTRVLLWTN